MDDYTAPDKMTIFRSFYEVIRPLEQDARLRLLDAILDYAFTGVVNELPATERGYFILMRPNIDATIKKGKTAKENGKNGGRPPRTTQDEHAETYEEPTQNPDRTQTEPRANPDRKGKDRKGKGTETDGEWIAEIGERNKDSGDMDISLASPQAATKQKRFTPPTVDEVQSFISENGFTVDAQKFVDYYTSVGWRVGRSPMKDWRATVRNWQRREPEKSMDGAEFARDKARGGQSVPGREKSFSEIIAERTGGK